MIRNIRRITMNKCILCREPLTGDEPPEHPYLDKLGAKFSVPGSLCKPCNNERMGAGPDKALCKDVEFLRNYMNFRSGKGRRPPSVSYNMPDGKNVRLDPGAIPVAVGGKPFDLEKHDDGSFTLRLDVSNLEQLRRFIPHIAAKAGVSEDVIVALLSQAAEGGDFVRHSVPIRSQQQKMGVGGTIPIRSMAKGALVLWMHAVGNGELLATRYDNAREFAFDGDDATCREVSRLDLRPLPASNSLGTRYGPHANLLVVSSNSDGRVLGHFRLYNAVGWCLELCRAGGPPNRSIGMVFDPSNPANRMQWVDEDQGLTFDWVDGASFEVGFGHPTDAFANMIATGHRAQRKDAMERLCDEVFGQHGFGPNEPIPYDRLQPIIGEISDRMARLLLRLPSNRTIDPKDISGPET